MRKLLFIGCALTILSGPAFAQYGGGGQNSGGPLGSAVRNWGGAYYGVPEREFADEWDVPEDTCVVVMRRVFDSWGRPHLRSVRICE